MNRIDWNDAQNLLVKLVQVLSPLTNHKSPSTFFLKRRFLPPAQQQEEFSEVRVLSVLKEVQKEVDEWVLPSRRKIIPLSKEAPAPVVKQAKELIHQIQTAIGELSKSSFIQKPKEPPLKKTLKELKPKLDQIIESIGENYLP